MSGSLPWTHRSPCHLLGTPCAAPQGSGAGGGGTGCRQQAARRRAGPGSQDSRFSPTRPLSGSVRTSLCLGFLICPVSHSGRLDGVVPRVSECVLPSGAGQGKRDSPWLSWSSAQTCSPLWTWAPSAHQRARGLRLAPRPPGGLQVASLRAQAKSEAQGSDHRRSGGVSVCKCVREHE